MVVSYNPQANSIQMVSVPRDSASFPFYFGGVDDRSTRSTPCHLRPVRRDQVGRRPVHHSHQRGPVPRRHPHQLLRRDGHRRVRNDDQQGRRDRHRQPVRIVDPTYDWLDGSPYGFSLSAGPHHLDGRTAMAYVRSRHGAATATGRGRRVSSRCWLPCCTRWRSRARS
jgi:hypothetical protein